MKAPCIQPAGLAQADAIDPVLDDCLWEHPKERKEVVLLEQEEIKNPRMTEHGQYHRLTAVERKVALEALRRHA